MSEEQQNRIIDRLAGNLLTCIKDQNGNHASPLYQISFCTHPATITGDTKIDRHCHGGTPDIPPYNQPKHPGPCGKQYWLSSAPEVSFETPKSTDQASAGCHRSAL